MLSIRRRKDNERGFTLLEYVAGAAIVLTTLWVAFGTMGDSISTALGAIGQWATERAQDINPGSGGGSGSGGSGN